YWKRSFAASQVPSHFTTATFLSAPPADSTPITAATASVVALPPMAQASTGASPFAIAAASPSQPGNPQAPQLAPGRAFLTSCSLTDFSTWNFSLTTPRATAKTKPRIASTAIGIIIVSNIAPSYANPAKPIKAIAISPRVTRVIGTPLKVSGNELYSILS